MGHEGELLPRTVTGEMRCQRVDTDGLTAGERRLADLEEQIRAWRNAFPMFAYHPTKHCITRDDFSGEPPEATNHVHITYKQHPPFVIEE